MIPPRLRCARATVAVSDEACAMRRKTQDPAMCAMSHKLCIRYAPPARRKTPAQLLAERYAVIPPMYPALRVSRTGRVWSREHAEKVPCECGKHWKGVAAASCLWCVAERKRGREEGGE